MPQVAPECTPEEMKFDLQWIKLGGICGLTAIVVYALMVFMPLPDAVGTTLAASFGPLFSVGSYGLYKLLALNRNSVSIQIAPISNAIAGALVTAMLLVQMSVRAGGRASLDDFLWTKFRRVDLGLDVAWDVYAVLGTVLFAWNMLHHPRFGRFFGVLGFVLAAGLAALNLATFPTPPANAGLVDLGPLVALWYVAVSVQMLRSRNWAAASYASKTDIELSSATSQ
ncbi:MAG: hypothetical protein ROO76_05780 [Terriglobia bacterium]|jgi:hypothetical protein|nr:hypothetical protein [Terriglobia bacterium]